MSCYYRALYGGSLNESILIQYTTIFEFSLKCPLRPVTFRNIILLRTLPKLCGGWFNLGGIGRRWATYQMFVFRSVGKNNRTAVMRGWYLVKALRV